MSRQVAILIGLNDESLRLDVVQASIDRMRALFARDQKMQLELDRLQTMVDDRRKRIADAMFDIPRRN